MSNYNPTTGIRYGVISMQSIDPDIASDLWHGPDAIDVTYADAYQEAKKEFQSDWSHLYEEAETAATETDGNMNEADRESFIERWLENRTGDTDEEMYVEHRLEAWSDQATFEECNIEGTYDGVKYQITWLGGAPLLLVLEGPVGFVNSLCSPCVPNAADLDSGFEVTSIPADQVSEHDGYFSYVVPKDWLYVEERV